MSITMEIKDQCDIEKFLRDLLPDHPTGLYDPVRYIMSQKGKKIRFYLTLKACELFSNEALPAVNAALAVEIFHNFTLIHDDIMDEASTRRNQPTVHEKWNINTGILSGDVMMILAYQSLLKCQDNLQQYILPIFTKSAREVCEGQQMDMEFESLPVVRMDVYMEMIRKKTAVLLGASLAIGAYCGQASQEEAALLYAYGENLGMAFQIRDDILDCYGDVQKVGKVKAGDIMQGKKTILYIRTWYSLDEAEQVRFTQLYHSNDPDKIQHVLGYFSQAEARDYAHRKEQEYFDKASSALDKISLPRKQKKLLTQYTHAILGRDY